MQKISRRTVRRSPRGARNHIRVRPLFLFNFEMKLLVLADEIENNFRSDLATSPCDFLKHELKIRKDFKNYLQKISARFSSFKKQQPKILRKIFKTQSELREVFEKYFQKFAE